MLVALFNDMFCGNFANIEQWGSYLKKAGWFWTGSASSSWKHYHSQSWCYQVLRLPSHSCHFSSLLRWSQEAAPPISGEAGKRRVYGKLLGVNFSPHWHADLLTTSSNSCPPEIKSGFIIKQRFHQHDLAKTARFSPFLVIFCNIFDLLRSEQVTF